MFFSKVALFSFLLSFSSATINGLEKRDDSTCFDVHLFLARGNGEAYPGRVGALANTVCNGLPSCDSENIIFNSDQSYCSQAQDGVAAGIQQINAYSARCPDSKLVLGGYSLGAHIIGDIVGGGGGSFYSCVENSNSALNPGLSPGTQVAAILLFGDVRHVADQSYNVGTGAGADGQYPRSGSQLSDLNQFSDKLRSWCLIQDPICAMGDDGLSHETYMDVFASDAGTWAQGILQSGGAAASSSIPVAEPTPTPTPTPSSTSESTSTPEPTSTSTSESAPSSTSTSESAPSSTSTSESAAASSTSTPDSTTSTSSSSTSETSTTSSSSSSTSSSVQSTTTSSSVQSTFTTSRRHSSVAITPFVFSDTAAATATTSTFTPSTFAPTTSIAQPTTSPLSTTSSKAGAASSGVQLTLNLITLVVIKVLAF